MLLILVQQVESFPLILNTWSSHILIEAKGSDCLVLAAEQELWVYSLKGVLLASFKEHTMSISSLCVVGSSPIWNSHKYPIHLFFVTVQYTVCKKFKCLEITNWFCGDIYRTTFVW